MKILITTDTYYEKNGVATTLQNTVKVLREFGNDVRVIYPQLWNTRPMPFYPNLSIPSEIPNINQIINDFEPDAIMINTEGILGLMVRHWCIKNKRGFTTAYHTEWPDYLKINYGLPKFISIFLLRWFHNASDTIMVTTETLKNKLNKQGFKKISIWGRGVSDIFKPNFKIDAPVYLSVGRVDKEKNLEALLDLRLSGTKVVGYGSMLETYKEKYPHAEYTGSLEGYELVDAFREASVLVFTSKTDTYGLVMLEAMRCGTPIAAYPVPGPIDIVVEGKNGSLNNDLKTAIDTAITIDRHSVYAESEKYTWEYATKQFIENLHAPHIDKKSLLNRFIKRVTA